MDTSSSNAPARSVDPGRVGLWTHVLDAMPMAAAQEQVSELAELGFGAVWIPEAVGRDPMAASALLLAGSPDIVVGTGIASIWARDAMAMAASHKTITEAFPGRFLLGLGVSHQPAVDFLRGHTYDKPLSHMRAYLDAMDSSLYMAAAPSTEPVRLLAALGPKMLELAAGRAGGAHPYFVPVEHTAVAREVMGEGPLLCVEQAVVLETDPSAAREIARKHTSIYLTLPNYTNNLKRFGWTDDDIADGGSDALTDAIVAWGDIDAIRSRVQAHHDAGADHVCVQVVGADDQQVPAAWRRLAPALLS
ncbi:MAG: LLM class F420-dependent oxidoreductase [Acidimicrobiales bacterium]